ncbi:MAG: hypothetical protein A2W93_00805 [Bacteroidetes bacterium GWF2_43_63]|nr:MAG: hypothetical protein A2W94_15125 [Bacteroidetes bacterium GWE2_42_42]OFY54136.1 MAG: hypothetical protein A2W93_00805 [Bacteroidetes bacterium GWF2_43_63]
MGKFIYVGVLLLSITFSVQAQSGEEIDARVLSSQLADYNLVKPYFAEAYNLYPSVPKGIIEAVAFTNTRFYNVPLTEETSSEGLPSYLGVMGFIFDGKEYFNENGKLISNLSGANETSLQEPSARAQIIAWAGAFDVLSRQMNISGKKLENYIPVLIALSEIPWQEGDPTNAFAMNSHLYSVLSFMKDEYWADVCGFSVYSFEMNKVFAPNTLKILQSEKVVISANGVSDNKGHVMEGLGLKSTLSADYAPALTDLTTCNYSSRSGVAVSAYVLHTVQGSYAGCISWFKNCSASASTHYVMRSSDGQVTQMVLEVNKAWHVRDENPYTIGTEMEGYVSSASWYTEAVYTSHSNLVRDVCNSGYGINPLRTMYRDTLDDGTALDYGVHVLAGSSYCTKIAGHQHYPNNDHTDPGNHWCWDYFFRKLNNTTPVTTLTTATGSFFDTGGSAAAYSNDERKIWTIAPANASSVTLSFSSFDVEDNYDFLYIYNGPTVFSPRIGRYNTTAPITVTASSGVMTIEFRSDCATTAAGWAATWTSATADATAPTTSIATTGTWKTNDFTANVTDADNAGGSGIQKGYYQVLENQGTEWRANASRGYFADNFDALHSDWTQILGTWSVASGSLWQSDTTQNNTNIYAALNQELSNRTLYQFNAMVPGVSKVNKRLGFHFFCDSAALDQRGNGYFVFFRLETNQLEFYEVTNNVFTQQLVVTNVVTNLNQWYDYKIIYDRIAGQIWVYRDDAMIGTWTDTTPYSTGGKYISFRTGNAQLKVTELKVYRSRAASVNVLVGAQASDDIRYENPSPSIYGAKIKSICQDVANNLSVIEYHDLNVDFTPPTTIASVNDGSSADQDISYSSSSLEANWTASADPNSDISHYMIAVGSTAGGADVLAWTNNGTALTATLNGLTLSQGTTYYISVKAVNNAGLEGAVTTSDGITIATSTLAGFFMSSTEVCQGDSIQYTNTSVGAITYLWEFTGGVPATSTLANPVIYYPSSGVYGITLHAYGVTDTASIGSPAAITVRPVATAGFTVNDTIFLIPDAMALFTNTSNSAVSYAWDFGDGNFSADVNPWHLYGDTGVYTVQLVAMSEFCGNDTLNEVSYITVLFPDGINEADMNQLTLYPNPAGDFVEITRDAESREKAQVFMYNLDGQLVYSGIFAEGQAKLKVTTTGFSSGMYQVVVCGEETLRVPLMVK